MNRNVPSWDPWGFTLYNTSVLIDLLEDTSHVDFGGQIIPNSLSTYDVFGYDFDDYWEDIGTIRSFYETNLLLAKPESPFNFYNPIRPIYTRPRFLPGSVVDGATLTNVLIAEGLPDPQSYYFEFCDWFAQPNF